jgi:hypothetical protein
MNEYTITIVVDIESDLGRQEAVERFEEFGTVVNSRIDPIVTGWTVEQS